MTSPRDVGRFHAEHSRHPGDRVALFRAVATAIPAALVLYPGSFVDIAPSVWFDDVTYVDVDKRAARFFDETEAVADLVDLERRSAGGPSTTPTITFHHLDYREPLPIDVGSVDLLISLYAGFVSEHCTDLLAPGGTLLVNSSHGDAAMASIDPRYQLNGVVLVRRGRYRVDTTDLDGYLVPKKPQTITVESLHRSGRGVAYTRSPFAYLFTRTS